MNTEIVPMTVENFQNILEKCKAHIDVIVRGNKTIVFKKIDGTVAFSAITLVSNPGFVRVTAPIGLFKMVFTVV